jgi:hypothetical protein
MVRRSGLRQGFGKFVAFTSKGFDGFKSGELHEKNAVATRTWEPSQHLREGRGKPRKPVEMAGCRPFWMHTDLYPAVRQIIKCGSSLVSIMYKN